jgi:DNA-binding beta-propeller fold protein YncE
VKKRTRRKIILLAVLVLLLALLGLWYWNFLATKSLSVDLTVPPSDTITAPQFLYAFAGTTGTHLQSPVGVLVDNGTVYVTDSIQGLVYVFREDGTLTRVFGKGTLTTPLYLAKNPKDGNLYITDRRLREILIFKTSGQYVGVFNPHLPKDQLPKFDTQGAQWAPVALDFAPDGTMYVVEILNGHRLLIFGPDGTFKRSVGQAGMAPSASQLPLNFSFPNSVKVHKNEVWVVDSNNKRVQVFDLAGNYKTLVPVSGLPRGLAFLPPAANVGTGTTDKFVVIDTLSHDGTIFNVAGKELLVFGTRGVLDGQFNYPDDVSIGSKSLIFITDTLNSRVQVWGWPQNVAVIPRILPSNPWWCLALLPLLLIPLFFRKKKFYATRDFVEAMLEAELVSQMPHRSRQWLVSESDYEALKDLGEGEIRLADLLKPTEYSDTDARALRERLEIDEASSATLAAAQRAKVFCTADAELRRLAKLLELDVVDRDEFIQRFGKKDRPAAE